MSDVTKTLLLLSLVQTKMLVQERYAKALVARARRSKLA